MTEQSIAVLLIEDDQDFAHLMKKRLGAAKNPTFTLICAESFTTALERLKEQGIEIILLDLNLKDSKGLETLTKLQEKAGNLPIVVLTGDYDESVGPETVRLGAQDYFLKGKIDMAALTRAMQYAIERKRYARELKDAHEKLEKAYGELEQGHEELRGAYTKITQLLAMLPSILIGVDRANKISHWNTVAERTFNTTPMDIIGKPLSDCGIEWDYSILERGISDCREKERLVRLRNDVSFKYPDGREGLLGFTINPVKDIPGDPTNILLYGADVTERRQFEAQLKQFDGK